MTAARDFRFDCAHQYRIVQITPDLIDEAATLAQRHALRGYDSVQLAAMLQTADAGAALGATAELPSADDELNAAAGLEQLTVENPNLRP